MEEHNRDSSFPKLNHSISTDSKSDIQWCDYEQELARLCSISSLLAELEERKSILQEKLESMIKAEEEQLIRLNKLDEMRQRLKFKKMAAQHKLEQSRQSSEGSSGHEGRLSEDVKELLVAGKNLSISSKKLQQENSIVVGERGYEHLGRVEHSLKKRQQYMITQVSFLYPVKDLAGAGHELELDSFPSSSRTGKHLGFKPLKHGELTVLGLQFTMLPFNKMSFFMDKEVLQRSATVLGYLVRAVFLISCYLEVPLRYPLRFGGSHSYVKDPSPSTDPNSSSHGISPAVEFPLFFEGQDTTRAAYAVFLLNKDLEQLLNFVGKRSVGPRHVLGNLKELFRTILSTEFIE